MLPSHYACTGCGERFEFAHRDALYYFDFDPAPLGSQVSSVDLFHVPVRPGWCKTCATVCLVEDIAPVRAFEDAHGAVRGGRTVEYPSATEFLSPLQAHDEIAAYLQWRLGRRHPSRALCCGGTNYQLLDVAQPLLKHADCESGVVEAQYLIGSYNGPGAGVYSPANIRVYNREGLLIGLLTWRARGSDVWDVVRAEYPRAEED